MLAGVVQATVGTRSSGWSGAKDNPVLLGVLTIGVAARHREVLPATKQTLELT